MATTAVSDATATLTTHLEATTVSDALPTPGTYLEYEEYEKYEEPSFYSREPIPMTLDVQIPTAIAIWILIIIAIIGNIMTIVAYITDKNLHNVYNYYIFHLAITDLLVAGSMATHSVYVLKGMMWPFGKALCKIWLVFDFTICLQTIFLMLILCVDRHFLVSLGMNYSRVITMMMAHIVMFVSWLLAFLVYGPAIIWWEDWVGESWVPYDIECDIEFANHAMYTTATAMAEFTLPCVCLTVLNMWLYIKIRGRNRVKPKPEVSSNVQTTNTTTTVHTLTVTNETEPDKDGGGQGTAANTAHLFTSDGGSASQCKHQPVRGSNRCEEIGTAGVDVERRTNREKVAATSRRDAKALRFLSVLVIVFLVCWAPYTIITMVISFCEVNCIDINVYELVIWILWAKAAINPFLYAFNSQVYKAHFVRYIKFWKR